MPNTSAKAKRASAKAEPKAQTYNSIDVGSIRRKQIIDCVGQIIARDGLDAVTIANIATELGTSRGVVVYHFDNKEAILHEALTAAMNDADASALRFERETAKAMSLADLISQVAQLAQGSNKWFRIYFAFLSQAHVNKFYRESLAWSDERYRAALARRVGDSTRAAIVLALMKGLAMQASVTPALPMELVQEELRLLIQRWMADNPKL